MNRLAALEEQPAPYSSRQISSSSHLATAYIMSHIPDNLAQILENLNWTGSNNTENNSKNQLLYMESWCILYIALESKRDFYI